ncbi:flagellin [Halorientalis marina]|jgi:flagellar protein FlaF|uniref:flagellin n=1 Tax=Halorientalis marina TaxID=2931976 RepID=UPI001FF42B5A|nr:flagellin [Halorientalis marina]
MGFSVSSSFAVIAFGTFVAMTALYTATTNAAESRQDAVAEQREHREAVVETAIDITSTDVQTAPCGIEVAVNNTGATELSVNGTDLLVDGEYRTGWEADATVDGDADTDVWLPGERLVVTVTDGIDTAPDRVKVVSESGVAATDRVTEGVTC